mmetsp:Transcript_2977/g.7079  ORF Transcript_2977/g.7079 Transcript_2977/m.7079 type:complete len:419 (-) Transcript_2977:180-1436(-)
MSLKLYYVVLAVGRAAGTTVHRAPLDGPVTRDPGYPKPPTPITLLPQDSGDGSPAALDGSPYAVYFSPSLTGSTKWTISIDGGGWCYDETLCYSRSHSTLGSSKGLADQNWCLCSNMNATGNGYEQDCNCLRLPYLDGASFSGYRAQPWPVPGQPGKELYFRGIKNLDAAVDFAMTHGMSEATEFVLSGGSAGGLSTFLHADRVAARVKAEAPNCSKIRAAPIVGFFLDHDNYGHTTGVPNTPSWTHANYTSWMKYIYTMQNLTFGTDGGLTETCHIAFPDEPWLCFMSPHMANTISTPFFMFNSKYDAWQLGNEFQSRWDTKAEQDGVLQYGKDFMAQLDYLAGSEWLKNGAMITSCICHGCPWSDLVLEGKSTFDHYFDWMEGRVTGKMAMHVDPRLPNGNGTLIGPTFAMCSKFP